MRQLISLVIASVVFIAFAAHAGTVSTGTIALTTEAGAAVWLDNRNVGTATKSAFTISNVAAGRHALKVSKPGYYDYTNGNVSVTAGQTTNLGVISLRIISGSIKIASNPTGATVFLDSQNKGLTPLTIPSVTPGTHNIKLTKTNYSDLQRNITVNPNSETNLGTIQLVSLMGTITVAADRAGTFVALDGQNKGRTQSSDNSLTIADVPPGIHSIRASRMGHIDYTSGNFNLGIGEQRRFVVGLIPNPGIILVGSSPGGATVSLNGVPKGSTPDAGQVSVSVSMAPASMAESMVYSRTLTLNLQKEGYEPHQQSITISSGQTLNLGTPSLVPMARAFLWVGLVPPDATVFLGEASGALSERGKGSLFIKGLEPGTTYRVKVQRRGFQDSIRDYVQGVGGMGMFFRLEPVTPANR